MKRSTSTSTTTLAWWATTGDETCPLCLQRYHLEMECRCAACDGPLCPSCAVRASLEVIEIHCLDCGADAPAEE